MSYTPIVPFGGFQGWSFLQRTLTAQKAAFNADPAQQSDEAYFRAKIGTVDTADKLVGDRRLLSVALKAFGLQSDINSKFFVKKILTDGSENSGALANKLSDKRYLAFTQAFGFGDSGGAKTRQAGFADRILTKFESQGFQEAVGNQNNDMRLAMNAQDSLAAMARSGATENSKWFSIMGNTPLRSVFETAFGLPTTFAAMNIDKQLTVLKSFATKYLGKPDVSQFSDPAQVDKLVRLFMVRAQAKSGTQASSSPALMILQQSPPDTSLGGGVLSLYV